MQFELWTRVIDLHGMTEIARDALLGNDIAVRNRITKLPERFMTGLAMTDGLVAGSCSFSQLDLRNILVAGEMSMGRVLPFNIMLFMTLFAGFRRF